MTPTNKPNSFVAVETPGTTQLNYRLQINPAPFTVSVPGSLEFVITNPMTTAMAVQSVAFTLQVGTGASIMPSRAGIATAVSDNTNWTVVGPPSPVTSGPATYILQPATGSSISLDPGASVVVQISQIQTNPTPGNGTIIVKETVNSTIGIANFQITTFAPGFFFQDLAATVPSGSALVPVAQVLTGTAVTLVWNSSIVDVNAFTIYYSNASQGQQTATPTVPGEWTSPPLTCDSVFTVVVTLGEEEGQLLTASLSTAVAVQNPSLIAAGINTGVLSVSDTASVSNRIMTHAVSCDRLQVQGTGTAYSFVAGDMQVENNLTVQGTSTLGNLSNSTMSGTTTLNGPSVFNAFSYFYGGAQISGVKPNEPAGIKPSMFHANGNALYMTWMPFVDEAHITFKLSDNSGMLGYSGSSREFKEDIQTFSDDFHKILDAKPVSFKFKGSDSPRSIGYIAEDFHDLGLHHLLVYNAEGEPVVIKYDRVALYQLEIIKELIREVESLKEKVNASLKPEAG